MILELWTNGNVFVFKGGGDVWNVQRDSLFIKLFNICCLEVEVICSDS